MEALLARAEPLLLYAICAWLALLTLWNLRLSGALRRHNELGLRSNGPPPHETGSPAIAESGASPDVDRDPAAGVAQPGAPLARWGERQAPQPSGAAGPPLDAAAVERERRLVLAFNQLASGPSADLQAFEAEWRPIAVDEAGEGRLSAVEAGKLWFVPLESGDGWGLILPGADIIGNWEKFYRNLRGASAPAVLAAGYDLVEGPVLEVQEPALGKAGAGEIRIETRGKLAGI